MSLGATRLARAVTRACQATNCGLPVLPRATQTLVSLVLWWMTKKRVMMTTLRTMVMMMMTMRRRRMTVMLVAKNRQQVEVLVEVQVQVLPKTMHSCRLLFSKRSTVGSTASLPMLHG